MTYAPPSYRELECSCLGVSRDGGVAVLAGRRSLAIINLADPSQVSNRTEPSRTAFVYIRSKSKMVRFCREKCNFLVVLPCCNPEGQSRIIGPSLYFCVLSMSCFCFRK
jgi:hypothetical protein